jgi:hypothetical protein
MKLCSAFLELLNSDWETDTEKTVREFVSNRLRVRARNIKSMYNTVPVALQDRVVQITNFLSW